MTEPESELGLPGTGTEVQFRQQCKPTVTVHGHGGGQTGVQWERAHAMNQVNCASVSGSYLKSEILKR